MNIEIHHIWQALLKLKQALKRCTDPWDYAILCFQNESVKIYINDFDINIKNSPSIVISNKSMENLNGLHSRMHINGLLNVQIQKSGEFERDQIEFIKQYLPYAIMPLNARKRGRTMIISHFAQSLDGKIATNDGSSQWIGNQENLIHAHRMRALCDAILIGSNTLKTDNPSLTVRKVDGNDPVKVVIGKSTQLDFNKLLKDNAHVIHITDNKRAPKSSEVETIAIGDEDPINCKFILECLYEKGIDTLYIEGGSKTASNFLRCDCIDVIQLHVAPMIMGSGIPSFSLPEISNLSQAIAFNHFHFHQIGNHIMFTGEVERKLS